MSEDSLVQATRHLATRRLSRERLSYAGEQPDTFYLITQGEVEVHIPTPGGDVVGTRLVRRAVLRRGELLRGGRNIASIVASYTGVDAATLDRATFEALIAASPNVQKELTVSPPSGWSRTSPRARRSERESVPCGKPAASRKA